MAADRRWNWPGYGFGYGLGDGAAPMVSEEERTAAICIQMLNARGRLRFVIPPRFRWIGDHFVALEENDAFFWLYKVFIKGIKI